MLTAALLATVGGLTRVWCHQTLGRFFTWQISLRADHALVTAGPYALVRHPSYTGWLALVAGNALLLFGPGSPDGTFFERSPVWRSAAGAAVACVLCAHIVWVTGGLVWRTGMEDKMLKAEFGKAWEEWARKTPYRLIPWVY